MTKEEQNQIIKDTWVKNIKKQTDIPKDIANIYSIWVQGIIKNASQQLMSQDQPQQAGQVDMQQQQNNTTSNNQNEPQQQATQEGQV